MLMHQKLILAIVLLFFGCFITIKFSIWFIFIPITFFILIFLITKDKNVLKIVVPISAVVICGAYVSAYFSSPSVKDLKNRLQILETDLSKVNKDLSKKQKTLSSSKNEQGWLRSTFNDSKEIDHFEDEIDMLQNEMSELQKDIYNIKKKIRIKS